VHENELQKNQPEAQSKTGLATPSVDFEEAFISPRERI
jgi:hypothetical protein